MSYKDVGKKREYARKWISARRAEYFIGKACCKCGSTRDLELDHIDRTQKIDHKIWSWSKERRASEIAKCQILCRSCHQEKTAFERFPKHGSLTRYNRYGCRCDACRARAAIRSAKYRATKKNALVVKLANTSPLRGDA